jgi:hypothetical protein
MCRIGELLMWSDDDRASCASLDGCSLADVARANGARSAREVNAHGWLFRRSLDELARRLSYRR